EDNVEENLIRDWASLFTDRGLAYRDDIAFLIWSGKIGMGEDSPKVIYHKLFEILREHPEYSLVTDTLTGFHNPGTKRLIDVLEEINSKDPRNKIVAKCLEELKEAREPFVVAEKLGIAVVIMLMVKSYLSGVAFNVDTATKSAGKSRSLWKAWSKKDMSSVYVDEKGIIIGAKPRVVSFEVAFGYGETVVGGMVDPDKYVLATEDGENWFIITKNKGAKQVQMIDLETAIALLEHKKLSSSKIMEIARLLKDAVAYDEVSRKLAGVITTYIPMRYLKGVKADAKDKEKKKAIEALAKKIDEAIKSGKDKETIFRLIESGFVVTGDSSSFGVAENKVNELIDKLYQEVAQAKEDSRAGKRALKKHLGKNNAVEDFIKMSQGVWSGQEEEKEIEDREAVLDKLRLSEYQFTNFAYVMRALLDGRFTSLIQTTLNHQKRFCLSDEETSKIAGMVAAICLYYGDDRDIEFAIEIDDKAPAGKRINLKVVDASGSDITDRFGHLYNVQARPYTAEIQDIVYRRVGTEADKKFIEKHAIKPIARGTKGENAAEGVVYKFNPNKTVGEQADDIRRIQKCEFTAAEMRLIRKAGLDPYDYINRYQEDNKNIFPIILYLVEADPSHDPLMRIAKAVVTLKGGATSHAAIFCREQGIPGVAGIGALDKKTGDWVVVDANNGLIYDFDIKRRIPIKEVKIQIKPYLIPFEKGDPYAAYIMAAENSAHQISPTMLAPDAKGIALARAEFKGEEIGINVIAAYGYSLIKKIEAGQINEFELKPFQRQIISDMREHPWVAKDIETKLFLEGYETIEELLEQKFYYFYNSLSFSIAPGQKCKVRAYDFAQDKVTGMIGSEIFSWPGSNPLVGLRGTSLEILFFGDDHKGMQDILEFILDAVIKADQNTKNLSWFNVFVRTAREAKVLTDIILKKAKEIGHLPSQVGFMIEVPSDAFIALELARILEGLRRECENIGIPYDNNFFSFGTNDYTNLAGKTDRDDPRIQKLKILHPAALAVIEDAKKQGYPIAYDKNTDTYTLSLADEGADVLIELIEAVSAVAKDNDIELSLCGQAIVNLAEKGDTESLAKIIAVLDSYGLDIKNRLAVALIRFDVMRTLDILIGEPSDSNILFKLVDAKQSKGVVKGRLIFVEKDEDLISDELKGLTAEDLSAKVRHLTYNNPKKLHRVNGDTIVVLTGRLSSVEELEKRGIGYDDLQYARAILVDDSFDIAGCDLLDPAKGGLIKGRIKANVKGLKARRAELDGKAVTIDYATGNVYKGSLKTKRREVELRRLTVPEKEASVETESAFKISANGSYNRIKIHPLVLLLYRDKKLEEVTLETLEDILKEFVDEADKISKEKDADRKAFLVSKLRQRAQRFNEPVIGDFMSNVCSNLEQGKTTRFGPKTLQKVLDEYYLTLTKEIHELLGQKSVEEFIRTAFLEQIREGLSDMFASELSLSTHKAVYAMSSLNCLELSLMRGGFLVEFVNPNPAYGLLGASRAISDFWQITDLELEAFKEARMMCPNLALQIAELKGVTSHATLIFMMAVLKAHGLEPAKETIHGLEASGEYPLEIGIQISTPADVLYIRNGKYLACGINFITIDTGRLGCAWLGADSSWDETVLGERVSLVTADEIREMDRYSRLIIKEGLHKHNKKLVEYVDKTNPPASDSPNPFPATIPAEDLPDRKPTSDEVSKLRQLFGAAPDSDNLINNNVVISPSLNIPAMVYKGVLYVNPNVLRGPPEYDAQLKVIFEGHELAHLLGKNEQDTLTYTIAYLTTRNLLEEHIVFLRSNSLGIVAYPTYIKLLEEAIKKHRTELSDGLLFLSAATPLSVNHELPFSYTEQTIDIMASHILSVKLRARDYLEEIFRLQNIDEYHYKLIFFAAQPLALVAIDSNNDIVKYYSLAGFNLGVKVSGEEITQKQLIEDYLVLANRRKSALEQYNTLVYEEARRYLKERKPTGVKLVDLLGGKGESLSRCSEAVDVPPGLTVSAIAYYAHLDSHPELKAFINERLSNLDTMDDTSRGVVAEEIQTAIRNTSLTHELRLEVLLMYRHLNILRAMQGKDTPVAVAVRSSGIHEDIEVSTWMEITTGSQAGQAESFLNVKGEDNVEENLIRDWASLFTDRGLAYRDDIAFLIWSGK
ncbi:MAG: PEP/pyruvate-binding domain-containing protein, partial [Candidatus Omnitrophota bacterium]